MTFLTKRHVCIRLAAPLLALALWAGPTIAASSKDTGTIRSREAVELYKSISKPERAAQQQRATRQQQPAKRRATAQPTSQALQPLAAPANDNFADAIALQGRSGTETGTNVDADNQSGEPNHASVAQDQQGNSSSVWYTFTPNRSGVVVLDTFGSSFNTVLAVYTGSRVNNLFQVTSNDDAGQGFQSQVAFQADAGRTYRIAADGFRGEQGNITLNFQQQDLSPNDDFADAIALQGRRGSVVGNNFDATVEPGEPSHANVGGVSSVWYTFTPDRSGVTTLQVSSTDFSPVLAVYEGNSINNLTEVASDQFGSLAFFAESEVTYRIAVDGVADSLSTEGVFTLNFRRTNQSPSPNDDFADAIALQGQSDSVVGNNVLATAEPGEPSHADVGGVSSVWYTFTPNQSGVASLQVSSTDFFAVLAVYQGNSVNALTEVASDDRRRSLVFFAEAGVTYRIAVDGDSTFPPTEGVFTLSFERIDQPPSPNDDFADAIPLEGQSGTVFGNNVDATSEPGEPAHAGVAGISSVWYTLTPIQTGVTFIDTNLFESGVDTVLAVYTGDQVDSLVEVASNDDASADDLGSTVAFQAEAGTTYRIAVDGFGGAQGAFTLDFQSTDQPAAPNDDFADAIALEAQGDSVDGNILLATEEPGEPIHGGIDDVSGPIGAGSSVWYSFTPDGSGVVTLTASVPGGEFFPVLAAYQGDSVEALTEIASVVAPARRAELAFFAEAGATYRIAVDADSTESVMPGPFTLNLRRNDQTPPANDDFENADALEGGRGSVSGDTSQATREGGEPAHVVFFFGATRSLWYSFTPNRTGVATFDTFDSDPEFDTLLAVYTGADLESLEEVASNDDTSSPQNDFQSVGVQSEVAFLAERGNTYYVAVDGFGGDSGTLTLNYRQSNRRSPPNDAFSDARRLVGESGVASGFNVGASAEPGEPVHADFGMGSSVWWRWQAPFTGDVTFTTVGSSINTTLAVYQGDAVSDLVEIASNDNAPQDDPSDPSIFESLVRFEAQEGQVYRIAVDSVFEEGSITLAFTRGEARLEGRSGEPKRPPPTPAAAASEQQ